MDKGDIDETCHNFCSKWHMLSQLSRQVLIQTNLVVRMLYDFWYLEISKRIRKTQFDTRMYKNICVWYSHTVTESRVQMGLTRRALVGAREVLRFVGAQTLGVYPLAHPPRVQALPHHHPISEDHGENSRADRRVNKWSVVGAVKATVSDGLDWTRAAAENT